MAFRRFTSKLEGIKVVAGFMIYLNTWGLLSTFPVFQTYFETGELFEASSSNISWIGSIQSFLLQLTGIIAGPLYDRGYLRFLLCTGSLLVVLGLMMLSLCTEYWQALLAQAFCLGIGAGLLFVPTVSLIPTWFSTRVGLAIGLASSGSSLGGVIYPIVLSRLLSRVGFPWAVRAVGFIVLATSAIPVAVLRMRVRATKPRDLVDWSALPRRPIAAIFNAGSTLGRILPNALSDHIGVFNHRCAPDPGPRRHAVLHDRGARRGRCHRHGRLDGLRERRRHLPGARLLPPADREQGHDWHPRRPGLATAGLGLLLAGPIAGAILGTTEPLGWTGLWVFPGATVWAGALILLGLRFAKSGLALKVKC
ncbi:hypothetical protein VTG60DRAFT_538 [Thermothelomyces hinnuleus]